jgi:hypothetical protein
MLEDEEAFIDEFYDSKKKLILLVHGLDASIDSEHIQSIKNGKNPFVTE